MIDAGPASAELVHDVTNSDGPSRFPRRATNVGKMTAECRRRPEAVRTAGAITDATPTIDAATLDVPEAC
jgi:hypothetical protein